MRKLSCVIPFSKITNFNFQNYKFPKPIRLRIEQQLDGLDLRFDMPEDYTNIPSLPKNIDTETAEFLVVEGQVHFHFFLEFPTLLTAHQREREGFELFVGKRWRGGLLCRPVDAIGGSRVDGQVEV